MDEFRHLRFIPIYERSVTYRRLLSNLFWFMHLSSASPWTGGGGNHGLMWEIDIKVILFPQHLESFLLTTHYLEEPNI